MNIDKDQILQLLRSQGQHQQADQASNQLPDQVDTDNTDHQNLLSQYGIDPSNLPGLLSGLGNSFKSPTVGRRPWRALEYCVAEDNQHDSAPAPTCQHAYDLDTATLAGHRSGRQPRVAFPAPQRGWNSEPVAARCPDCDVER
jgi:hypothetical protein